MEFCKHQAENGVVYLTAPGWTVHHAFTTRIGGVSAGHLAALNLGENRGDAPENVRKNYRQLGAATGIPTERLVFPKQVHGNTVRTVAEEDIHPLFTEVPDEADGLVTNIPGLPLICFTADCVPVLLWDEVHGVAGAIHCGWRSSVADILKNAVTAMENLGAEPAAIRAAIGPSIGYCCFEVGGEVIAAAERYLSGETEGLVRAGEQPEKYYLDLRGANARRLIQLGLLPENIAVNDSCTVCEHKLFWSHRYTKGQRGSQGAVIML